MSQLKITTNEFNLQSTWRCSAGSNGTYAIVEGPTTATHKATFAYSLPTGSIINSVKVYATLGSPLSGAAIKSANDVDLAGNLLSECVAEQDTAKFDAAAGSYTVNFKFKAYGQVFSDTKYHSGSLGFRNVYLLIDYTVPNSTWTPSTTRVEAGGAVTINVQPAEASCSHELVVKFGALNETYSIAAGTTTYSLNIPYSWLQQIPNSTTGVATLQLKTLLNGVELGVSDSVSLTVVCPESVVPTVGSITTTILDAVWGLCVQKRSKVRFVINNCQGTYGSSIEYGELTATPYVGSYWSTVLNGNTMEIELVDAFSVTGAVSFQLSVVDSRGRRVVKTASINVVAYNEPSIMQTVQGRADAQGNADAQGTYVYAGATYSYTAVGTNSARLQIYYREDGAADWNLAYEGQLASGAMTHFGGNFDTATVYELKYVVSDDLHSSSAIRTIGTAYVFMRWDPQNNAIGFGCVPRSRKMLEVGSDWSVYAYGKDIQSYTTRRNFVDNGYFLQPVNQRRFDEVFEPCGETWMYLDRWEVTAPVADFNSWINFDASGVHLMGASASDYIEMRQRFEDYSNMTGGWYTVHCCIDSVEYCHAFKMGQVSTSVSLGGLLFYSTSTGHIAFRNQTATEITMQWVALYQGQLTKEQLPPYVPKGHGAELAECARYFARVGSTVVDWTSGQVYCGAYIAAKNIRVYIPLLTVLRQDPEVDYGGWMVELEDWSEAFQIYKPDGTLVTVSNVVYRRTENGELGIFITVDDANAGTAGMPVMMFVNMALHCSADV